MLRPVCRTVTHRRVGGYVTGEVATLSLKFQPAIIFFSLVFCFPHPKVGNTFYFHILFSFFDFFVIIVDLMKRREKCLQFHKSFVCHNRGILNLVLRVLKVQTTYFSLGGEMGVCVFFFWVEMK
jgi:hypothetical protein